MVAFLAQKPSGKFARHEIIFIDHDVYLYSVNSAINIAQLAQAKAMSFQAFRFLRIGQYNEQAGLLADHTLSD